MKKSIMTAWKMGLLSHMELGVRGTCWRERTLVQPPLETVEHRLPRRVAVPWPGPHLGGAPAQMHQGCAGRHQCSHEPWATRDLPLGSGASSRNT